MTHLIGCAVGVVATVAAICLAYGAVIVKECVGWECE